MEDRWPWHKAVTQTCGKNLLQLIMVKREIKSFSQTFLHLFYPLILAIDMLKNCPAVKTSTCQWIMCPTHVKAYNTDWVYVYPATGQHRFYFIHQCHTLNLWHTTDKQNDVMELMPVGSAWNHSCSTLQIFVKGFPKSGGRRSVEAHSRVQYTSGRGIVLSDKATSSHLTALTCWQSQRRNQWLGLLIWQRALHLGWYTHQHTCTVTPVNSWNIKPLVLLLLRMTGLKVVLLVTTDRGSQDRGKKDRRKGYNQFTFCTVFVLTVNWSPIKTCDYTKNVLHYINHHITLSKFTSNLIS